MHAYDPRQTLQLLALPLDLGACVQRIQAEGQIGRELRKERELGLIEGVGARSIDGESTDALALQEERQGH